MQAKRDMILQLGRFFAKFRVRRQNGVVAATHCESLEIEQDRKAQQVKIAVIFDDDTMRVIDATAPLRQRIVFPRRQKAVKHADEYDHSKSVWEMCAVVKSRFVFVAGAGKRYVVYVPASWECLQFDAINARLVKFTDQEFGYFLYRIQQ